MKIYQVILDNFDWADEFNNPLEIPIVSFTNKNDVESFLERFRHCLTYETWWDGSERERNANIRIQEIEVLEHFDPNNFSEEELRALI